VTIRKGEEWGVPAARPDDLLVAAGDAELASYVATDPSYHYGLAGGDLYRSLGAPPTRIDMQRLPIDALRVQFDGGELLGVAHVVARNGWWRGPLLAVSNCGYLGSWNVAPRSHPNDGRFDVVEVDTTMTIRQRLHARRRLPLGTHVPHPAITTRTAEHGGWTFDPPREVYVDGVARGRCRQLTVVIEPDHFAIYV
jgi:hypothetical protein